MEKQQNWIEKYRVKNFNEIIGQSKAVYEVKTLFNNLERIQKKALLLHGPAGTGKTSVAQVAAKEFDLELYELNASDLRNKEQLHQKLKPASEQKSLFKKSKLLLIDEVDGLSASDRGGLPELIELIDTTSFPMIITANDVWDKKFNTLRKKCNLINLKELDYKDTTKILQKIAETENLEIDNKILVSISIRSKGDVRAAINDLQTLASDKEFAKSYLTLDERNKQQDIFNALKMIFKNQLNEHTLRVYDQVNMPLEKIFLWLEENIPKEYKGEELYKAFEALSLADIFNGRIRRQRYWRFLVYQNIFLSAGVSISKLTPKQNFVRYSPPSRILKIWMSNQKNQHKKTIIGKYSHKIHCSKRKAFKEFHLIAKIIKNSHKIQKQLALSEQEINYLAKLE